MLSPIQSLLKGRFNPIRAMILCVGITLAIFGVLGYNLHGMYTSFNKLVDVDFTLTSPDGQGCVSRRASDHVGASGCNYGRSSLAETLE